MKKSKIWISGGVHLKTLEEVRVESGWVEMMLGSRMGIGGSGGSGGIFTYFLSEVSRLKLK